MNKLNYATCGCGAAVRGAAQLVHAEHYGTKSLGNLQKTIIAAKRGICSLLQIQSASPSQRGGIEFSSTPAGVAYTFTYPARRVWGAGSVATKKARELLNVSTREVPPPSPIASPLQVHDIWPVRTHRNRHAHLHRHGESPPTLRRTPRRAESGSRSIKRLHHSNSLLAVVQ